MEASQEPGRLFAQTIRFTAGILSALLILLILPLSGNADPVIWLKGEIHLTEHGLLYSKPTKLTSLCYWGPKDQQYVYRTGSVSCLIYPCTLDVSFGGGTCDLVIEMVDGGELVLNGLVNDEFVPGIVSSTRGQRPWREFELTIDIGSGTHEFREMGSTSISANRYWVLFWIALAMTLLVEIPALLTIKFIFKLTSMNVTRTIIAGSIASLITLPSVWFLLPRVWSLLPVDHFAYCVAVAELLVVFIEAGIYRVSGAGARHAIWLSLIANALSFLTGVLLL